MWDAELLRAQSSAPPAAARGTNDPGWRTLDPGAAHMAVGGASRSSGGGQDAVAAGMEQHGGGAGEPVGCLGAKPGLWVCDELRHDAMAWVARRAKEHERVW